MKHSESLVNIAPALARAQAKFGAIHKDATNPFFNSKFASMDNIMTVIRPTLTEEKLAVIQGVTHPETVDGELVCVSISTMVLHESGEWIESDVVLPVGTTPIEKGKPDRAPNAHTASSATSYGRRIGLAAAFALTTDDDDDGNGSSQGRAKKAPPPPPVVTLATRNDKIDFGANWQGKTIVDLTTEEVTWANAKPSTRLPERWRPVFASELENRQDRKA